MSGCAIASGLGNEFHLHHDATPQREGGKHPTYCDKSMKYSKLWVVLFIIASAAIACGDDATGVDPGGGDAGGGGGTTCGPVPAGAVSLASDVTPDSQIAEVHLTGSQARISFGDGSPGDIDGLFDVNDPSIMYGPGFDVFPREGDFQVGSLGFDATGATGCLAETLPVTTLDLSELWTDGSSATDISGRAMTRWLFGLEVTMRFGDLDPADTVTFTDGILTSVDVEVAVELEVPYGAGISAPTVYGGTLTFRGDDLSLSMDDTAVDIQTALGVQPQSRMIIDIEGTVIAVDG